MKKIFSILLIPLALVPIAGFMPFYFTALQEVKNEMTLALNCSEHLDHLFITDQELRTPDIFLLKGKSEFCYRGKMYDFTIRTVQSGGYTFLCMADNKETLLMNWLRASYEENLPLNKDQQAPLSGLLKNLSKEYHTAHSLIFQVLTGETFLATPPLLAYLSEGYVNLFSPPPDFTYPLWIS